MKNGRPHHKRQITIPISIVAGFAPGIGAVATQFPNVKNMTSVASIVYLGYDPSTNKFNPRTMAAGTLPVLLGVAVHKFIGGTFGVNRMLAAAGVPFIRL